MSYIFFESVLEELGHKLNYDAVVNYAGNGFCEKSWEMITKSNPMHMGDNNNAGINALGNLLNTAPITIIKKKDE